MKKAVLVESYDWEGLYIDGVLVKEGHSLNEGESRISSFVALAKKYEFSLEDLEEISLNSEDCRDTEDIGCFYKNLSEFKTPEIMELL